MNTVGNLGQMVSVPIVANLAVLAGTPGHPSWKASLYYYAAMFFCCIRLLDVCEPPACDRLFCEGGGSLIRLPKS
jgi:hypothetical protein